MYVYLTIKTDKPYLLTMDFRVGIKICYTTEFIFCPFNKLTRLIPIVQ